MVQFEELLARLVLDYPDLRFRAGKKFAFRPARTVRYEYIRDVADADGTRMDGVVEQNNYRCLRLLHEVGHALKKHRGYRLDVERVVMEREAWEEARILCERYGVSYDEEFVEAQLDSYRDWLHRKSVCPACGVVRYQADDGRYHCPMCEEYGC